MTEILKFACIASNCGRRFNTEETLHRTKIIAEVQVACRPYTANYSLHTTLLSVIDDKSVAQDRSRSLYPLHQEWPESSY